MADRKFSEFTDKTDPILSDTVGLFDITGGTPAEQNRRMTWENAFKIVDDFPPQANPLATDTTNIFSGGIAMKATLASLSNLPLTVESYTDTSRLITATDLNKHLVFQGVSSTILTLPELSTETLAQGFTFRVTNGMPSTFTFVAQGTDIIETTTGNLTLAEDETATITLFASSSPNSWQIDIDTAGALAPNWFSTSQVISNSTLFSPTTISPVLRSDGSYVNDIPAVAYDQDATFGHISDMLNVKLIGLGQNAVYETETRTVAADTFKFNSKQLYGAREYIQEILTTTLTLDETMEDKSLIYPISSGADLSLTLPQESTNANIGLGYSLKIRNDSNFKIEIFTEGADEFSSLSNITTVKSKQTVDIAISDLPAPTVRRWFVNGVGPTQLDFLTLKTPTGSGITPNVSDFIHIGTLPVFATLNDVRFQIEAGTITYNLRSYIPNSGTHALNFLDLLSSNVTTDFSVVGEEFDVTPFDQNNTNASQFLELYLFVTALSGPSAKYLSINVSYSF